MSLQDCLSSAEWWLEESGFDFSTHNVFETLFTVGNGYLGTRGSLEEGVKGELSGTFIAGIFDAHDASVTELVNAPDWLPLAIWVEGERLNMHTCRILEHRRVLDFRHGVLYRDTRFEDSQGRCTRYESLRFASFACPHLCLMRAQISPENYSGLINVQSGIDGERYNLDRLPQYPGEPVFEPEVKWEKWARSKHLRHKSVCAVKSRIHLTMETLAQNHQLSYASSLQVHDAPASMDFRLDYEKISQSYSFQAQQGKNYIIDKRVAIYTSRDASLQDLPDACLATLETSENKGFEADFDEHKQIWAQQWLDCDSQIEGDDKALHALRFSIYHLLIAANRNDPKVNIGAKSLSGEGYKGHAFWDTEIFLLPFYLYTQPETAKSLLSYRYYTLPGAIENAKHNGFEGAQYPWESADTGKETTPKWTQDGAHRLWMSDEQIHISADVAYGVFTYLTATQDWSFMAAQGAEIVFQSAWFWQSRLEYNADADRYELSQIMGPDEFHEHVNNNVYTNWMTKWHLQNASALYARLQEKQPEALRRLAEKLPLTQEQADRWAEIADKIYIPLDRDKKLIEAFAGYFQLKEVPICAWDENQMPVYPRGYHHFNVNETTLLKQPDVVMLLYVLPDEFDNSLKQANYEFYESRTLHKSSLSPGIHSIMGIEVGDTDKALQYFLRSAFTDLSNNQGNTEWGMHIAAAGATWQCAVFGFGGLRVKNQQLTFKPWLPEGWTALRYRLKWRGDVLTVAIYPDKADFLLEAERTKTLTIKVFDQAIFLRAGQQQTANFANSKDEANAL